MIIPKLKTWEESKHPRGQPENAGEFGSGGGNKQPGNDGGLKKEHLDALPAGKGFKKDGHEVRHLGNNKHELTTPDGKKRVGGSHEIAAAANASLASGAHKDAGGIVKNPPANQPQLIKKAQIAKEDAELNEPMGFYDIIEHMKEVPHEYAKQFDVHQTSLQGAASLLNGGIDKSRNFHTISMDSYVSDKGNNLGAKGGDVAVLSHPGKSLKEGGIGALVVSPAMEKGGAIPILKQAFPGVAIFGASQLSSVLTKVAPKNGPQVNYEGHKKK